MLFFANTDDRAYWFSVEHCERTCHTEKDRRFPTHWRTSSTVSSALKPFRLQSIRLTRLGSRHHQCQNEPCRRRYPSRRSRYLGFTGFTIALMYLLLSMMSKMSLPFAITFMNLLSARPSGSTSAQRNVILQRKSRRQRRWLM